MKILTYTMNICNLLTLFRLIAIFPILLLFEATHYAWALSIFTIAICTDFLDGYLARKWNLITSFGKLMDPLADKILIGACLVYFTKLNILPAWITAIIIGREFAINGIRQLAAKDKIIIAAHWTGKWKTISQTILIFTCFFLLIKTPLLPLAQIIHQPIQWTSLILTLLSGTYYISKFFQKNKKLS